MPVYEYGCSACHSKFEVMQRFSDPPLETCEKCGAPVKKLISNTSFVLKGSGWYVTDYAQKGKKGSSDESTSGSSTPAASDSKPGSESGTGTDAKSETKADTKTETKTDSKAASGSSTASSGGGGTHT